MRLHLHSLLILLYLFLFVNAQWYAFLYPFRNYGPVFYESRLFDVTTRIGLDKVEGNVVALGDYNGDKYTDLFVLGCNDTCIQLYKWEHEKWQFVNSTILLHMDNIVNVITTDFNYDGALDLMVLTKTEQVGKYEIHLFVQSQETGELTPIKLNDDLKYSKDQVTLLDSNSDLRVDLFGTHWNTGKTAYWRANANTPDPSFEIVPVASPFTNFTLTYPATNSFVDIDGDCSADLVVSSCTTSSNTVEQFCEQPQFHFFLNKNAELTYKQSFKPPKGAGQMSWVDFDRDGNIDLVIPVCYPQPTCSQENYIAIYINQQKKMCSTMFPSPTCRSWTNLCEPSDFKFDETQKVIVKLPQGKTLPFLDANNTLIPPIIRFSDYNMDGFPDLIMVTQDAESNLKVELWQNVICEPSLCTEEETAAGMRTFTPLTVGVQDLAAAKHPINAFFFDFDDTGTADIIVNNFDKSTGRKYVTAFYNNFYLDGYFFKSLVLNGVPHTFRNGQPFGVNMPGTSVKVTITDLSGNKRVATTTHLTQSAYMPLQTPYYQFGIGRTASYIEEFFVGIPITTKTGGTIHALFQGLIPNAQVIVTPHPVDRPADWGIEMFVNPSTHLLWVVIAYVSTLIVLAIPIIIMYRLEKRADEKEKKAREQSLSNVFV